MRILMMISSLEAGGAEKVLTQLANYWAHKKKHDIHVLIFRAPGAQVFHPLSQKVTLHCVGQLKPPQGSGLAGLRTIFKTLWATRKIIKDIQPQCLISFTEMVNIVALLLTRFLKIKGAPLPVIVSERIDPQVHKIDPISHLLRRILYPCADKLIVQGRYILPYFKYMASKVSVIPNPIAKAPSSALKTLSHKFITVGRLAPQKDQKTLVKAFAKVVALHPDSRLEIYGQGPERERLSTLIKELDLSENIHLKGVVKDIGSCLDQGSIFVFPSLYEGFPNALGEAMAVGLPVIASDCGGNLELIQDGQNGLIFPIGKEAVLADKMLELMGSAAEKNRLGGAAQKSIEKFSFESVMQEWDEAVEP